MIKLIQLVVIFVLLINSVNALELIEDPPSCADTKWYKPSTWFPCMSDKAIQHNMIKLQGPAFQFETFLIQLSIASFDAKTILPYWVKMNYLAGILFLVVVAYAGYLFLFSSIDISKRIQAKQQVWNIFLIILFTNLSLFLALLILEISNLITRYIWTSMLNEQIAAKSMVEIIYAVSPILSIFYFLIFLIFGIPLLVKMVARFVILIAFLAALPLIVTLNFFLPTRQFGVKFIRLFFINAFFPILWILVFLFGKIVVDVINAQSLLGEGLAEILVFAGALYLNNYLYKALALNFSLRHTVSKAVHYGAAIWRTAKTVAAVAGA